MPLTEQQKRRGIAVLRMVVGAAMTFFGAAKLLDPGFLYGGLLHALAEVGEPYRFYNDYIVLRYVVLHETLFAYAVGIGELLVGLSLLTGTLVSWGALGGIFLMLNFALATSSGNVAGLLLHLLFIAVFAFLGRAGAGVTWGVDGWLTERIHEAFILFPFRLTPPGAPRKVKVTKVRRFF